MVAMESASCGKKLCKRVLPSTPLYCRCGIPFCSEACFVSQWHAEHRHACPHAAEIKREVAERRSSSERSGTALLVATALSRTAPPTVLAEEPRPVPEFVAEPMQATPALAPQAAEPPALHPAPSAPLEPAFAQVLQPASTPAVQAPAPAAQASALAAYAAPAMQAAPVHVLQSAFEPQPANPKDNASAATYAAHPATASTAVAWAAAPAADSADAASVGTLESVAESTTSVSSERRKSLPRFTLDSFFFGGPIGSGSYGQVRKVVHKKTAELFAIKEIPKKKVREQQMTEYLMREVKTQLLIQHPNILRLFYYFEDSQKVYLLLEYANGGSLFSHLRKRGKLPEQEAAPLFVDVASALDFLHKRGIVHRDLKPENILMCLGDVAKIADFGWCAEVSKDGEQRNTFCGTWDYLSPEMVQNQPHDYTVDIWAAGVLLFEMLTGRPPFSASSQVKALNRIMEVDLQIPEMISALARDLICELLRKEPADRLALQDAIQHPWVRRYMPEEKRMVEPVGPAAVGSASSGTATAGSWAAEVSSGTAARDAERDVAGAAPGAAPAALSSAAPATASPDGDLSPDRVEESRWAPGLSTVPTACGWQCPTGQPLPKAKAKAGATALRRNSKSEIETASCELKDVSTLQRSPSKEAISDMQKSSDFMQKLMVDRLEVVHSPINPSTLPPDHVTSHSVGMDSCGSPSRDVTREAFQLACDASRDEAVAAVPVALAVPADPDAKAKEDARADARARLPSATAALLEALRTPKLDDDVLRSRAATEHSQMPSESAARRLDPEPKPEVSAPSRPQLPFPERSVESAAASSAKSSTESKPNSTPSSWQETDTFRNIQKWVRKKSNASMMADIENDRTVRVPREHGSDQDPFRLAPREGSGQAYLNASMAGNGVGSADQPQDALRAPMATAAAGTQRERPAQSSEPLSGADNHPSEATGGAPWRLPDKGRISPSSPLNGIFSGGVFDREKVLSTAYATSSMTSGSERSGGSGGIRGDLDVTEMGPLAGALVKTGSTLPSC